MRYVVTVVLLAACANKEAAAPPTAEAPAPVPPAAPPASPNPHPEAKNFSSASARPKALSGQVLRHGKVVDVATLDAWAETSGCDGLSTGGDVMVGGRDNKTIIDVHVRGDGKVQVGQTYELSADREAPVFASTMREEGGLTNATSGKVTVNQLKGGVDLEVEEADFGALGKVSGHLVTGAPLNACP